MRRTVLLILGLLTLSGCTQNVWRRSETIIDQRNFKVVLEQVTFAGEPKSMFGHPTEIAPVVLENAFTALRYEPRTLFVDPVPEPAIAPEYLRALASNVSSALSIASDSERVRFEMLEESWSMRVLPTTRTTQGVAFVSTDGALNVVFDEIHALPEIDPSGLRKGWGKPTRRARTSGRLAVPSYATHGLNSRGTAMRFWAVLPIDRIPTTEPKRIEDESVENKPKPNSTPPAAITDSQILTRLRFLEELYQDGSLSEAQYEAKRAELLRSTPKKKPGRN